MARRNSSSFVNRRLQPKQDVVRIYKTEESSGRISGGSIFSYVTNLSDTGTYEIEICEKPSMECVSLSTMPTSSKVSIASVDSGLSKCENCSGSRYSQESSKPEGNILGMKVPMFEPENGLLQSYYPCLCVANQFASDRLKTRVVLVDKDTNTFFETVDRGQSCSDCKSVSSKSTISQKKENDKLSTKTESENNSTCSTCTSSTSTCETTKTCNSSEESNSNRQMKSVSSNSSRSSESPTSGDSVDEKNQSTDTGVNQTPKDSSEEKSKDNDFQRGKTNIVLELIREEEDEKNGLMKAAQLSRNCNCGIKNYEERLKKLENFYFSSGTTKDEEKKAFEKSKFETQHQPCDCKTAIINFTEITHRMNTLEKMYKNSLEKEEEKDGIRLIPENLDNTTRTAIELAKIKKRLVDLEEKIMKRKFHYVDYKRFEDVSPIRKDRKISANMVKAYVCHNTNKLSDKEVQVIDSEKEQERKVISEEGWRLMNETKFDTYYFGTKADTCNKTKLKDEAIQTPSKKQVEGHGAENEIKMTKRKIKSKKIYDRISLCKGCHYYLSQKSGAVRRTSKEKLTREGKIFQERSDNCSTENINRIKKSFASYPINISHCLASKETRKSNFREGRRFKNSTSRRNRKRFKLCSKDSMTNFKESFSPGTGYGEICSTFISNKHLQNKLDLSIINSNELNVQNCHIPHQSVQIYYARESSDSNLQHNSMVPRVGKWPSLHSWTLKNVPSKEILAMSPLSTIENKQSEDLLECTSSQLSLPGNFKKNLLPHSATMVGQNNHQQIDSTFVKKNSLNLLHHVKEEKKVKIPLLFEEICNSSRNQIIVQDSKTSLSIIKVAVKNNRNGLNPWKKIFRKFSHSQFTNNEVHLSCIQCENPSKSEKDKSKERNKAFNLTSIFKKTWI